MKTLNYILLLALLTSPLSAFAQSTLVIKDPEPNTRRCQDTDVAFQYNGDVVIVEYFGQWKTWENGIYSQNGGVNNSPCGIERIVRVGTNQHLIWELKPSSDRSTGFASGDRVSSLKALPDGGTLVSTNQTGRPASDHTSITLLNADGDQVWRLQTQRAARFGEAIPYVGDDGEIFVEFRTSNFGYSGGEFQLPGGKVWRVKKNRIKTIIARLDPATGMLMWERKGARIVSAHYSELLTTREVYKKGRGRYQIVRRTYDGDVKTRAWTPWFDHESLMSATRTKSELVTTAEVEFINPKTHRVERRADKLRVFNFKAKQLHQRDVSYRSTLAEASPDAPIRIVAPSNCAREQDYVCQTDALSVLTLTSWDDPGEKTQIRVADGRFSPDDFHSLSTADGLWLSARTFYRSSDNPQGASPSVTIVASPDDQREASKAGLFSWKKSPQKRAKTLATKSPVLQNLF